MKLYFKHNDYVRNQERQKPTTVLTICLATQSFEIYLQHW